MRIAIIIMFFVLALTPLAGAQEELLQTPAAVPTSEGPQAGPSTFDLPPIEAMEWRAIDAEIRAIRSEAQQAIIDRSRRQAEIMDAWKARYGLKDMNGWEIDAGTAKIQKRGGINE